MNYDKIENGSYKDENNNIRYTNINFQKGRPYGYYRKRQCPNYVYCNKNCSNTKSPCCQNIRCSDRQNNKYVDVCYYDKNRLSQPIPQVKTITIPRNVYTESKTRKKQPYSYSITEMIRNQQISYKEDQKKPINNKCFCKEKNCTCK